MPHPPILCVGLTPALQRTLRFDGIQVGEVNRARSVALSAAGKGVNVAQVLKTLGRTPLVLGFLGGTTGQGLASDLEGQDISSSWVSTSAPTRNCHTLIDIHTGQTTELVEEMACPSPAEWAELDKRLSDLIPAASWIILSGKLPPGAAPDVYATIVRTANEHGIKSLVDSQGAPLLETLAHHPFLVKLNAEELGMTLGQPSNSDDEIENLMRTIHQRGATWVVVTQGAHTAYLFGEDGLHTFHPPTIDAVNPIGSGDAVAAGMVHALLEKKSPAEAAATGLACGTAAALEAVPGTVDPEKVAQLRPQVRVEKPQP